jgi:hypothetical protein
MRPRACFRVELHRGSPQLGKGKPFDGAVVQRHVRGFGVVGLGHGEAMVLTRHQHTPGRALEHRVVRAPMPEGQLERLMPRREAEQLMAEADTEDGRAPE